MGQPRRDKEWPLQPTRHVWVQSPEHHRAPDPGVVVEWRQNGERWLALVLVVMERDGAAAVLQRWFDSRDLAPIRSRPQSPDRSRWHLGWVEQ